MATTTARLTPHTDQTPAVAEISTELSGSQWCSRFPGSRLISGLNEPFQGKVQKFISAMETAGITVFVSATYRPKERAYLMHYCAKIARGAVLPGSVAACAGVNIEWDHGDLAKSKAAAQAMSNGYGIVFPPAYPTHHSDHLAIDMTLTGFAETTVKNESGTDMKIIKESDLYPVGKTYGVIKLLPDHPHWSDNGT